MNDNNQTELRTALHFQFGAAIDVLENAIRGCPERLWNARLWDEPQHPVLAEYWYIAFHTLFWLDFYLCNETEEAFTPEPPFTKSEFDPGGVLPPRGYTRDDLLTYLAYGRAKCKATIMETPDLFARQRCKPNFPDMMIVELLIYTMRHVQEHAMELNMYLGQQGETPSAWVSRTRNV